MRWLKNLLRPRPEPVSLTPDLQAEIRRSFEHAASDEAHFPSSVDERLYHVKLLLNHLGPLDGARVLDAGCGKGRFARVVKHHHSSSCVVAMDLAVSMLQHAHPSLARAAGSLLQLPFASDSFDAAFAIESLEHAVDIELAVAELCRVLKPGARLLIIDKNAEHWGRLDTPRWERWFHKDELLALLRRHCRHAEARPISYWEDVPPDGLFLAWLAVK